MAAKTGITWTDHTFNPWWGCVEVSPGCDNCYARSDALRYGHPVWGKDAGRRFFGEKHWNEPRKWNKQAQEEGRSHRVFCASMADIAEVNPILKPEKEKLWNLIRETRYLDWLILTKRPSSLISQLPNDWGDGWPQVWLGTTVENNDYRWRIPEILKAPAQVHFLSVEPQIGPVDLSEYLIPGSGSRYRVDWVIIGGESGGKARPFQLDWARDLISVCTANDVALFNKQLGSVLSRQLSIAGKGAKPDEWPEDIRIQQFPEASLFQMREWWASHQSEGAVLL